MIQSTSHLLPFTLLEETIMGCDGPLSSDEDYSHFLDGCVSVCVLSVLVYAYCAGGELFHNKRATWNRHGLLPVALWREAVSLTWNTPPPLCTHTLSWNVCLYYLMETHWCASQGHIVISCSVTCGTHRSLGHVGRDKDVSWAISWKDRIIPVSIWVVYMKEFRGIILRWPPKGLQESQFRHAGIWLAEQEGGVYLKAHIVQISHLEDARWVYRQQQIISPYLKHRWKYSLSDGLFPFLFYLYCTAQIMQFSPCHRVL